MNKTYQPRLLKFHAAKWLNDGHLFQWYGPVDHISRNSNGDIVQDIAETLQIADAEFRTEDYLGVYFQDINV